MLRAETSRVAVGRRQDSQRPEAQRAVSEAGHRNRAHAPFRLPGIVLDRFLARIDDDSGGQFLNHDVQTRQYRALVRGERRNAVLGHGLAGVPLDTKDAVSAFIFGHYDERNVAWYNRWEAFWMDAVGNLRCRTSDTARSTICRGCRCFTSSRWRGR